MRCKGAMWSGSRAARRLLFGRAGEEIAYLRQQGVEVDLINGISAGLAAAASLGMSLTHRDYAHGVTFVTAHRQGDREPDWQALAATRTTLVIYMGMTRIDQIAVALLQSLPTDTPAAVVQSASSGDEHRLLTTSGPTCPRCRKGETWKSCGYTRG